MKFAIILAGCGVNDGSETNEVSISMLSLTKLGISWDTFAPNIASTKVINHITGKEQKNNNRNVLEESARLVRGQIAAIDTADISKYDAILVPGGFGVVTNLCDFSKQKEKYQLNPDIANFFATAKKLKKPMGFMCIAPILIPKIYHDATLTIGNDKDLANIIQSIGAKHIECKVDEVAIDNKYAIVSTPANMLAQNLCELESSITKLVFTLQKLCK